MFNFGISLLGFYSVGGESTLWCLSYFYWGSDIIFKKTTADVKIPPNLTKNVILLLYHLTPTVRSDKLFLAPLLCTALESTAMKCTAVHRSVVHCPALLCNALHCKVLHCTSLHIAQYFFSDSLNC